MTPLLARKPAADRQFERIYQRHVADVYRYVLVVLRNPVDAEDVTQTTFLNAYRAFQRGERPDTPKNWLIAIAHNVCRQRFRQQQRRPNEVAFFEDGAEAAVVEDENEFSAHDIQRAIGLLAFNQRAALVMRELEGRSYAEIAEIMGLTVGAVETLIFRARRALREQLEGSLTCAQAELALSKQADGMLSRQERGQLRAHLRECKECESLARRSRASRGALKAMLGGIPLPGSLASFFGGGGGGAAFGLGAGAGAGVAAKAAAVVFAGAVLGSAGYEGSQQLRADPAGARQQPRVQAAERPVAVARTVARSPVAAAVGATARRHTAPTVEHAANRHPGVVAPATRVRAKPRPRTETKTAETKEARPVGQARRPKIVLPTQATRGENDVAHARPHRSENDVKHARPVKVAPRVRIHPAKPARPVKEQRVVVESPFPAAALPKPEPGKPTRKKPEGPVIPAPVVPAPVVPAPVSPALVIPAPVTSPGTALPPDKPAKPRK